MKQTKLFISQYWDKFYAKTIKELKEQVWPWKIDKMYIDKKNWDTIQTGYVIWQLRLNRFIPFEKIV